MLEIIRRLRLLVALSYQAAPRSTVLEFVLGPVELLGTVIAAVLLKLTADAVLAGDSPRAAWIAVALGAALAMSGVVGAMHTRASADLILRNRERLDREIIHLTSSVPDVEHYESPTHLAEMEFLRNQPQGLSFLVPQVARAAAAAVQMVVILIVLVVVHPFLLAFPLVALPSFLAQQRAERLRQKAWRDAAEHTRQVRHLFDLGTDPSVAKEIRVQGLVPELVTLHRAARADADRVLRRADLRAAALTVAGWLLYAVAYLGGVLFVVDRAVDGRMSLGDVLLVVLLTGQLNRQILAALVSFGLVSGAIEVSGRFIWLRRYAEARQTATSGTGAPDTLTAGIELSGVGFTYPGTERPVLHDIDLRLPAGKVVAIVGENGAGKTTLVKLLTGMYQPTEGGLLVDGAPLTTIDVDAWRSRTSAVFQDFHRFEFTAGRTVGLGDLTHLDDDVAVVRALDDAGAGDVTGQLPQGLETPIGRSLVGGIELSGGQWQKLALGRGMMRPEPLLLVLDEPTSSLDALAERELFERYASRARSRDGVGTVTLLISHRFSTVRYADLIVVLTAGAVAEIGTHAELVAAGGLYAELYELQAAIQ